MLLFQVDKVFIQSKINLDRHGCYGVTETKSKYWVLTEEKLEEINARLEHVAHETRVQRFTCHILLCF
jgi:hypothetical protein